MTEPSTPPDLDAIRARAKRSHAEIVGLCDGGRRWTMRVPAQSDRDSDLVLSATVSDVEALLAEVERLRARVHEAVDECQRRYGPVESQLVKLRNLMRESMQRHNEEMATLGRQPGTYISGYGQATAAVIIAERDEARAEVERLRAAHGRLLKAADDIARTVYSGESFALLIRELIDGDGLPQPRTPDSHVYRSTACLHGLHDRCASEKTLAGGPKVPAVCKWCSAPCVCDCGHLAVQPQPRTPLGYLVDGKVRHPADVTIIFDGDGGAEVSTEDGKAADGE